MLARKLLIILFFFFTGYGIQAQSFEIRTINKGFGIVGVQVRETADVPVTTSNFVTDMVFGVKWDTGYHVDLASTLTTSYNIKKSGMRMQKDGFYFQSFYADNTPYNLPENWTQNDWIEVLSVSNTLTGTDTGSFQICETGFDETTNPNIGIDLTDYTPTINGEANGVVLPVNLLSFTASPVNNAIKLNWSTTSEINSKGFDVQRSVGNANHYVSVGFVNSWGGNGRNSYDFTDDKANGGVHYYYRLRQVDINGNYRFSDTKDAMLDYGKNALLQLSPNPAKEMIHLQFSNDCATKPVSIIITDSKGAIVSGWKETMQANKTVNKDVSGFASGQYFLVVEDVSSVIYKTAFQKM